jgi:hypothetical protein
LIYVPRFTGAALIPLLFDGSPVHAEVQCAKAQKSIMVHSVGRYQSISPGDQVDRSSERIIINFGYKSEYGLKERQDIFFSAAFSMTLKGGHRTNPQK